MPLPAELLELLGQWSPFLKAGGWVIAVGIFLVWLSGNRFERDEKMAKFNAHTLEDLQGDFDEERKRRGLAEARGDRWRAVARWWNAKAHDERSERVSDRIASNQHYGARLPKSEMMPWDPILPLPLMVELQDEAEGHL